MDLLTAHTHHLELQVIAALPPISIFYISSPHLLSLFPARCVFISRSLARDSNNGVPLASRARSSYHSHPCRTLVNYQLKTIAPSFISLPCRAQLHCQPSTDSLNWPGVPAIQPRGGPNRKHRLYQFFYCYGRFPSNSPDPCRVYRPLPSNAFSFLRSLHSNGTRRYIVPS
jgi:hypothetical protein